MSPFLTGLAQGLTESELARQKEAKKQKQLA